jgi:hypothetical protein
MLIWVQTRISRLGLVDFLFAKAGVAVAARREAIDNQTSSRMDRTTRMGLIGQWTQSNIK